MANRRFFIIGEQRSGTIALGDMLNSHSEIEVFGEVFLDFPSISNKESYFDFISSNVNLGHDRFYPNYEFIQRNLVEFFHKLTSKTEKNQIGIQIKYDQLNYLPELIKHLQELGFACVHMIRPTALDIALSQLVLKYRQDMNLHAHTGVDDQPVIISDVALPDKDTLKEMVKEIFLRIENHREILQNNFCDSYYEVFYPEVYSSNGINGYTGLLNFLHCKVEDLSLTIKKSITENNVRYKTKIDPSYFEHFILNKNKLSS